MHCQLSFPDINFQHAVKIQTRFADYDSFRHVNNNAYMAYFDLGKSEFFNYITGSHADPVRLGAVIVNISVDFMAPAMLGEPLEVLTSVVELGDRSFRLYQRIVNTRTQSVKAQSTTVLAGFDVDTCTSAPLSQQLKSALQSLLNP